VIAARRNCGKSPASTFHGMKVQDMKSLKISAAVLSMATLLFACPLSVSCPADHVDMHKVGDDYSGLVHFVIYEHQTSAGQTHQVSIRCD
jgi:hypothetical protein